MSLAGTQWEKISLKTTIQSTTDWLFWKSMTWENVNLNKKEKNKVFFEILDQK